MVCIMELNLASWVAYPTFKANAFKVGSSKCLLKLLATCWRQYRWYTRSFPSWPLGHSQMAYLIPLCWSEIMQMPSLGMTCSIKVLRHSKNHPQLGLDSLSTTTKAIGKTFWLASVAIVIINTPLYLPYKWVPSILITGLQYWNAVMHGANAQYT